MTREPYEVGAISAGHPKIIMDEEIVIGFEALYKSMYKCKKGVLWKDSAAHFFLNGIRSCLRLEKELKTGSYKPRPTKEVAITFPKPRTAVSIAFRDRVYQRSLNDNVVYPMMTKSFIYANMACQHGKGTDPARDLLVKYMRRAFMRYGPELFVLQMDIKSYYGSICHEIAEKQISDRLPPEIAARANAVLQGQYDGKVGYNPGSQLVQIVGIAHLNGLDHYIKEHLGVEFYIRYQDDLVLIHHSRSFLERCNRVITAYLAGMKLRPHPKKTRIYHISEGISFLGFTQYLTKTGKVVQIIDTAGAKSYRRKMVRMAALVGKGKVTPEKMVECYSSRKAHVEKGNTKKHLARMDNFVCDLMKGVGQDHVFREMQAKSRRRKGKRKAPRRQCAPAGPG